MRRFIFEEMSNYDIVLWIAAVEEHRRFGFRVNKSDISGVLLFVGVFLWIVLFVISPATR